MNAFSVNRGATIGSVLVIDDDQTMRDSLRESLVRRGFEVCVCPDGPTALARFGEENYDAILCDMRMPEMDGVEVCKKLRELGSTTPIIMITAYGSVETAVEAMKHGAFDYITKPFKGDELQVVLEKALAQSRLLRENRYLRAAVHGPECAVGESPAMKEIFSLIERYARNPATVLIRGESGTGKEVIARMIHRLSPRSDRPFVCVNCAALSAGLLESELFGHEKGAFTGADQRRQGRFELAEGGTLLLDEVSEIDPGLQAKLLRVLQEKTFERVGSSRSITADVRVVATSNRDLEEEVRLGNFREDLFYRLNVLPIELPPLRLRRSDIPLLARHFLEKIHKRSGGSPRTLDRDAERALVEYDWPGNVRELENVIERGCLLTDSNILNLSAVEGMLGSEKTPELVSPQSSPVPKGSSLSGLPLREVERILIEDSLKRHGGHQQMTATELGIGVRTLRTKIKKWGLSAAGRSSPVGIGGQPQNQEVDESDLH